MVNTKFIFAYDPGLLNKYKALKNCIEEEYPWVMHTPPQFFKSILVTPLIYEKNMNEIFEQMNYLRSNGDHSFLMFDSGGFQINSPTNNITQANIVERNLYLYNIYDNADAYVLADVGLGSSTIPIPIQKERVMQTITLTQELYERLPERIQVKSVPVYQVGRKEHIDMQFESHSKISEHSGMVCYAIPPPKKLTFEHMKWIMYLKSLQPNTKIHLLGSTSQPAFFAMQHIGVDSCDSISPIAIAVNGEIATYTGRITISNRAIHRQGSSEETIDEFREKTGHRCPFCDENNRDRLANNQFWRIMHNIIVYIEISDYYRKFTLNEYKTFSKTTKKWAVTLERALDSSVSIPEAVETATEENNTTVDNDTPIQMALF